MSSPPIASEKIAIERKLFFLDLKENQRGRFLKITEDVGGRRDTHQLDFSSLETARTQLTATNAFVRPADTFGGKATLMLPVLLPR